jgi:hypothetical protein
VGGAFLNEETRFRIVEARFRIEDAACALVDEGFRLVQGRVRLVCARFLVVRARENAELRGGPFEVVRSQREQARPLAEEALGSLEGPDVLEQEALLLNPEACFHNPDAGSHERDLRFHDENPRFHERRACRLDEEPRVKRAGSKSDEIDAWALADLTSSAS